MLQSHAFEYESCDVPQGLTLAEYRRAERPSRPPQRPTGGLIRLRVLRRRAVAA
jgi:hypothetical protein